MIEQLAVVITADDRFAVVEPQRRSTCESCGVKGACGTSLLDRVLGRRPVQLRVANAIGARAGDQVLIGVADVLLLRAAVVAYLLPVLGLILGGALALELVNFLKWPGTQLWSLGGGVLGFALSLRWVADYSRRLRNDPRYHAELLERVHPEVKIKVAQVSALKSEVEATPQVRHLSHPLRVRISRDDP